MISCEYPDKLYFLGNWNDCPYVALKTAWSYLHSSGQNTGTWRTARQTDRQPIQRSALRAVRTRCKNDPDCVFFAVVFTHWLEANTKTLCTAALVVERTVSHARQHLSDNLCSSANKFCYYAAVPYEAALCTIFHLSASVNKSSAIAEMATQCCTIQIFAVECGVPLFNALFLNNLWKYRNKSHTTEK